MTNTMVLVVFACISPCVRNRMITDRIKFLRIINREDRIGFTAFFSAINNPQRAMNARTRTTIKFVESQPKFCPKEGMQRRRLKNATIKIEPRISKFVNFLGV